jgi:hypothetical protein
MAGGQDLPDEIWLTANGRLEFLTGQAEPLALIRKATATIVPMNRCSAFEWR